LCAAGKKALCKAALADLWQRNVAELERTKQPGGADVCHQLKRAGRELRANGKGSK
jgi:hypothetical protein